MLFKYFIKILIENYIFYIYNSILKRYYDNMKIDIILSLNKIRNYIL